MLSKKTKYGLKAISYISKRELGTPILISEISEEKNIPRKFLEAILLQLKNSGFLGSKKGKGGGYYLLKDPETITLASLIRVLEGPIAMLPCVSLNFYEKCEDCASEEVCSLNVLMSEVRDGTLNILERKKLTDL